MKHASHQIGSQLHNIIKYISMVEQFHKAKLHNIIGYILVYIFWTEGVVC